MPRQGGVREKENNDVEEIAYDYNLSWNKSTI